LPTVLDEKLLRVTLTLEVVKMLPATQDGDKVAAAPQPAPGN
jgi:hypothetical protein